MSKEMKLAVRIFAHFVKHTLFVIARRERKGRTRQSIVSRRDANEFVSSLPGSQWIATGWAFSPRDDKILYAGATLAGMALLGCRPFGPGPPRSAWLSASAVILPSLAHCFWKPTRKPMLW